MWTREKVEYARGRDGIRAHPAKHVYGPYNMNSYALGEGDLYARALRPPRRSVFLFVYIVSHGYSPDDNNKTRNLFSS